MQKKAINETEFRLLIAAAKQNKSLQAATRGKLVLASVPLDPQLDAVALPIKRIAQRYQKPIGFFL
jgi:hypothetical protein